MLKIVITNIVSHYFILKLFYRLSSLNHSKADIITKPNGHVWNPEVNIGKSVPKTFQLPWKLIGDTVEDSIVITFNLKNKDLGEKCPNTDSGLTVYLLFYLLL